jgi:hypothetical protein
VISLSLVLNSFVVCGFLAILLVDVWLGFFYSFLGILLVGDSVVVIAAC